MIEHELAHLPCAARKDRLHDIGVIVWPRAILEALGRHQRKCIVERVRRLLAAMIIPGGLLLIAPAILAGAFMASIDNAPVSLIRSTARIDMLPIRMCVLITAAFLLMLIMEWTAGLTRRMHD